MNEPLIRDIPSIKNNLETARMFSRVKLAMPLLRPLLRMLKVDVEKLDEAFSGVDALARKAAELARIPDRFNDLFVERGWILYDRMSLDVAKTAISAAEAGDLDAAENILINYFGVDEVRRGLMTMHSVEAFRPRMELAHKALLDFEAERYHACVPVVLALLDGMVNEVHQKARGTRRGIAAEGVDLSAWDSFAAHDRGLNRLVKIFQTGRRRTTTERITLPYRNGIMHGIDLGYDNRAVATKTWAALFAAREWAVRAEQGLLNAPEPVPVPSLLESLKDLAESARLHAESQEALRRVDAWEPRRIVVGQDVPHTGAPDLFADGTPEQKLAEFLHYWNQKNYGYMARSLAPVFAPKAGKAPAELRAVFGKKQLLEFEMLGITDESYAISVIRTLVIFREEGDAIRREISFRMLYASANDQISLPGQPGAAWGVVNWRDIDFGPPSW